jgi:hypothetical protein
MQDNHYSFSYAFYPAAVLCFIAAALAFAYNPEVKQKPEAPSTEQASA